MIIRTQVKDMVKPLGLPGSSTLTPKKEQGQFWEILKKQRKTTRVIGSADRVDPFTTKREKNISE